MARPRGSRNVGVRWRDGGWELQCNDCVRKRGTSYWPLTDEFWDHWLGMTRCRACHKDRKNRLERERYKADPELRAARQAESRRYRRDMRNHLYRDRYARMKADPEKHAAYLAARRERCRAASARYRARLRVLEGSGPLNEDQLFAAYGARSA